VFLYEIRTEIILLDHEFYILYSEHPRCDRYSSLYRLSLYIADSFFITSAVHLARTTIELLSNSTTKQAEHKHLLWDMLLSQYDQTYDANILPEAITLQREIIPLKLYDSIYARSNLITVLQLYYDQTGDEKVVDEAVDIRHFVLNDLPLDHPEGASLHLNLSVVVLKRKFEHSGNIDILRETFELNRQALRICPTNHSNRSHYLSSLGTSLCSLFS
jgi:hypothetical protein